MKRPLTEDMRHEVAHLTTPGYDHDGALAMLNQALIKSSPIDDVQVLHLLRIGFNAGLRRRPPTRWQRFQWALRGLRAGATRGNRVGGGGRG